MTFQQIILVGAVVMLFATISSFYMFKHVDKATKIICLLLLITFLNERLAVYSAIHFKNSNIVYAFFSPVEVFIISLYFNYSIDSFRKKNIGIYVGIVCCVLGFVDLLIQTPSRLNNFFLLTESIVIVAMSLYSYYRMLLNDDDLILVKYVHFWFTTIFLFFWTSTFLFWGIYEFMTLNFKSNDPILHIGLLIINIITYIGFGLVFLNYKKMTKVYG